MKRWIRKFTRPVLHLWQRLTRGFDDSVTWSLDASFEEWIVPRLKRYYEVADEHILIEPDFRQAIEEMIEGFSQDKFEDDACDKLQKAYDQFAKWHGALWW